MESRRVRMSGVRAAVIGGGPMPGSIAARPPGSAKALTTASKDVDVGEQGQLLTGAVLH
jgi:hypothetical protein